MKTVYKRFDLTVDKENTRITDSFELDKNVEKITGILLSSNKDEMLYYRGSQSIEINKEEIFPESYESKLLMSGLNINPNMRFHELKDFPVGNGSLDISYTDSDDVRAKFETYRVSIYIRCLINH